MALQTRTYYEKIARELRFPSKALIDGKFVDSVSGKRFTTVNPANGQALAEITSCGVEDVLAAETAARKAFEDGRWAQMSPQERKSILLRFSQLLLDHADELSVMESLDSGKPISDTVQGDVPDTAMTFAWYAEAIDKLEDSITATDAEHVSLVVREPLGVVGAILPWNFPMQMASWKLAPILATGNSVIVKPAKLTSLTMLRMAELAMEAGLPDGVLNVLPGSGNVIGTALGTHPWLEALTFTGSTAVGKQLLELSGRTNAKRILLEMGGKNPCIVMPDVKDLDYAAAQAVNAVFWNMGENCTSNSRLLVHRSIKDAFLEKVIAAAKEWKTGEPLNPDVQLGALVERSHMEQVLRYIKIGKAEGAKLVYGGRQLFAESGGNFVEPAVFDDVTPDMTITRKEIFGPVLAVMTFETEEEAIRLANDTEYGLQASLFTDNIKTAHRMARALRSGTVSVNCYSEGDIGTPFGGFKQSGFFSRDKSLWAARQYTELKTIWMQI
ncbi:aldehyde dehydrogenase [Oscillibacter sp. MSJ-2]|uniref:Aldehyde dehydrogenase n=1 Tax=Dysosmobacter acutus TaxID=2841504 RepID=A0ABS6FE83_9FIRM|nr:aldehyde dehydrogenase [Dysosmobacter acutus]MBU5627877.1 aldehyde dehydrogenase [Dysosmobacter acutus]